jgi:hypothetical protein
MASSSNPYEHYNSPQVEDDLIDPDDGRPFSSLNINHDIASLINLSFNHCKMAQLTFYS